MPRLPRKAQVGVAKCYACHVKVTATQKAAASTPSTPAQASCVCVCKLCEDKLCEHKLCEDKLCEDKLVRTRYV